MPVPVPRAIKPIAHPVVKSTRGTNQAPSFNGIPSGPPPSLTTRDEWISSLPSWRRSKPRRIWEEDPRLSKHSSGQDFLQGLAFADNAMVIKGLRAEACLPPLVDIHRVYSHADADVAEECGHHRAPRRSATGEQRWEDDDTAMGDAALMVVEEDVDAAEPSPNLVFADLATYENQTYHCSSYRPSYEDHSPGTDSAPDTGSSPLGPVTPFADFIDRAVAAVQPYQSQDNGLVIESSLEYKQCKDEKAAPTFPTLADTAKEHAPAADVVAPSATNGYKQLAEPISEWLAGYVWKVCTTGLSLPALFRYPSSRIVHYSSTPPSYLAPSIHSLLLSTLLQPSAIFLSLWYIVRLPGYFNAADLGPEYAKDTRFRQALLGETYTYERETLELNAPFRLFVLGCMLANKWLDDHTFSNKTWHTISNVPVQILNRLEMLALDVFAYDLSILPRDWNQWMAHLKSYHMTLASPHLQPISRPSSNPHSIIRKSIDEILQAPSPTDSNPTVPQPVFLGIEERKRERVEAQAAALEVLNIDLDEDGPLREEYVPRRRTSNPDRIRVARSMEAENISTVVPKPLPPPAKWSPAADEPILRDRSRSSGHYVAVQPSHPYPYSVPYRATDVVCNPSWDVSFAAPFKAYPAYAYGHPPVPINAPQYSHYPPSMATMTHSRSQSLFYDSEHSASRNHLRSYSQAHFDQPKYNDARMASHDHSGYESEYRWGEPNPYIYGGSYAPGLTVAW